MDDTKNQHAFDTSDDEVLPPTDFEIQQARHAKLTSQNERRERIRLAAANRKAGISEPRVGDRMWVSVNATLTPRRTRAGVMFEKGVRQVVEVVDTAEAELADRRVAARAAGAPNPAEVTVYGAEQILADEALNVHKHDSAVLADNDKLRESNIQLEEENRLLREEAKRLRAARMAAPESSTGAPTRLQAAAATKASGKATPAAAAATHPDSGFGGSDFDHTK